MNAKKFSDAMSELDTKYVDEAPVSYTHLGASRMPTAINMICSVCMTANGVSLIC